MLYVISQLAGFLLLVAAFAALAGWAYAGWRARPEDEALRRQRDGLVRDLSQLAAEPAAGGDPALADELSTLRRRAELETARAAEAVRAVELARSRAEDAAGQVAELQRALEQREAADAQSPNQFVATEAEATPVGDDAAALQAWRQRYFEQRVRYLEGAASAHADPVVAWRARVAEARAAHLEQELRDVVREARPPQLAETQVAAFAANAETDALLRWRMLYLERRVSYLQSQDAPEASPPPIQQAGPDSELWKWRARYLEARVRHLAASAPASAQPEPAPIDELRELAPPLPDSAVQRPDTLQAARGGAPDDFTLIEGVSLMQQTTLYSLGIFHFDQIATWTAENVAWVDRYLRLRGRIVDEEWVDQADELARDGPPAARRALETEDA